MPLTREQELRCAELLRQLTYPTKTTELFEAILNRVVTSAFELAVLRPTGNVLCPEVLLIWRKDKHFKGWHMPGTMILGDNSLEDVFTRLVDREIGLSLERPPRFVHRFFTPKGTGPGDNPRGTEIGLLHLSYVVPKAFAEEPRQGDFFLLTHIPKDTLEHHKRMIMYLESELRDSKYKPHR